MSKPDIRWQQRLDNFARAFSQLSLAVQLATQRPLSELEKQGLIQAFGFTHELAWNVMKDYLFFQGHSHITGSRDATRESFAQGLIDHGEIWMEMIKSRNQTTHTYNQAVANDIVKKIIELYHACFEDFGAKMQRLKENE